MTEIKSPYCVIGGLAVNAYVEPVVSLDIDIVITLKKVEAICRAAERRGLNVEPSQHSVKISSPQSDLRIQLQTDQGKPPPQYKRTNRKRLAPRPDAKYILGDRLF